MTHSRSETASRENYVPPHPAKYADIALREIGAILESEPRCPLKVLDPFAGVGRIHELDHDTVGVEIEAEWAAAHPATLVGDATSLPFPDATFDAVVTSPCYGNRMADHHEARDTSRRHTYRHYLGRRLSANNAGVLQWGEKYQQFHRLAWREAHRVLRPGGLCVVVVSDHIRAFQRQPVVEWHRTELVRIGFFFERSVPVATRRLSHGSNANARVAVEEILVVRR
jgi:tRNA G10  N-methylase Trm11